MKQVLLLLVIGSLSVTAVAQRSRNFRGKSRRDFFGGAQDYRDISKIGLQISFGPNFTLTPNKVTEVSGVDVNNRPNTSFIDPYGRVGGFVDIGMAHYRLKPSKILSARVDRRAKNKNERRDLIGGNLIHRIDWGLGFDYIGGGEKTRTEFQDGYTTNGEGKFYTGYVYGRVTADRFTKMGDKWHLETGLGLNFNYAILEGDQSYSQPVMTAQKFQQPFLTQLHGHLGFNYKIRRGDYLVFGAYAPVIGIYEANKLKPTIQWYSSNYYPMHFQMKWIHHFEKKSNGCNTGTPEDRKRNQEYMQNR